MPLPWLSLAPIVFSLVCPVTAPPAPSHSPSIDACHRSLSSSLILHALHHIVRAQSPCPFFCPSTFPVGCGFYTVMFLNTLTSSSSSSPSLPSLLSALTISTQTSQSSMLCFHLRQPTPLYPIPCLMHPTPHLLSSAFFLCLCVPPCFSTDSGRTSRTPLPVHCSRSGQSFSECLGWWVLWLGVVAVVELTRTVRIHNPQFMGLWTHCRAWCVVGGGDPVAPQCVVVVVLVLCFVVVVVSESLSMGLLLCGPTESRAVRQAFLSVPVPRCAPLRQRPRPPAGHAKFEIGLVQHHQLPVAPFISPERRHQSQKPRLFPACLFRQEVRQPPSPHPFQRLAPRYRHRH